MRLILPITTLFSLSQSRNLQKPLHLPSSQIPIHKHAISQPPLGFGTWNLKESTQNTSDSVAIAIESGFRQIDGAAAYGNEKDVGLGIAKGLKNAGIRREDIWVTSKLWNDHHGSYTAVESALNKTLSDLGLDYLDLYLVHWPVGKSPSQKEYSYDYIETWHSVEKLLDTGKVRNIGICNFSPAQLKDLIKHSRVKPSVHQMELHPYLPQEKWIRAHQAHGIAVTAYSPLGNQNPTYGDEARRDPVTRLTAPLLLEDQVIKDIAEKRDCTPAQVVLAWGISRGTSVIPKSKHEEYIVEDFGAVACNLVDDDLARIGRIGEEPRRFNNPSESWGVDLFEGLEDA